jgi:RNA polymerase sigma factor (TIGR02999 family)
MDAPRDGEITTLLDAWRSGEPAALDHLLVEAYPRLHHLADVFLVRERNGATLQATELVNELYITLTRQRNITFRSRTEFYSFAAYLIRLMLRTRARDRKAQKRGAGGLRVPLSEDLSWVDVTGPEILDLDRALDELAKLNERKARLVELTAFLGFSSADAAALLGISKATADRDLRFTRAWLFDRLQGSSVSQNL